MEEQTLDGHFLGNVAVGVALDGLPVLLHFLIRAFDFRLIDGIVAYDPRHLFCDIVLGCGVDGGCAGGDA